MFEFKPPVCDSSAHANAPKNTVPRLAPHDYARFDSLKEAIFC
jgi:hypothetical protein